MTDNSLTEYVALAIARTQLSHPHEINHTGNPAWTFFLPHAQAAISAVLERLSEPTEEMIEAGREAWMTSMEPRREGTTIRTQVRAVFPAMLAAAGDGQ